MKAKELSAAVTVAIVAGAIIGNFLPFAEWAAAARNSSGTYSLPSGNPVVTGTIITSTWANNTLTDIKSEITNSLDRGGRGGMTAPLPLANGTVAAPALTFGTDTDTGLYRIGANNPGIAAGGVLAQQWTATGSTLPLGAIVTQSQTDTDGLDATGNGVGKGLFGTGGSTSGSGVAGVGGAPNGYGIDGHGTGAGGGVSGNGGATGPGVVGTGGATSGVGGIFAGGWFSAGVTASGGGTDGGAGVAGIVATGGTTGNGGTFTGGAGSPGLVATGGTTSGNGGEFIGTGTGNAIKVGAGNAKFTASNPATTTAFTDTVTPKNIIKAWARLITNGDGSVTISDAFNITSCAVTGTNNVTCTLASAMSDTHFIVTSGMSAVSSSANYMMLAEDLSSRTTSILVFRLYGVAIAGPSIVRGNASTENYALGFEVIGAN